MDLPLSLNKMAITIRIQARIAEKLLICCEPHAILLSATEWHGVQVRYTQGQLRKTVSISTETFRHWKTVIPYLSKKSGHSAKFLAGDLLALSILKKLTADCSINVGNLAAVFDEILYLCNTEPWDELEKLVLCIDVKSGTCRTAPVLENLQTSDVMIIMFLATQVQELRSELIEMQEEDTQGQFILSVNHSKNFPKYKRRA